MKKYDDARKKISVLIKNGMPKIEASRKFGIPYRTVLGWTSNIKLRKVCPKYLRKRVRSLVKEGLSRREASRITGMPYQSVFRYTTDIRPAKNSERICGPTLKLLRELCSSGYVLPVSSSHPYSSYKTLRKYFPVKKVEFDGCSIYFLDGKEREAMQALLGRIRKKSIGYHELGKMRKIFGIKNIRKDNKIMGMRV